MRFSRVAALRSPASRGLGGLLLAVALLTVALSPGGCAHAPRARGPEPAPARPPEGPSAQQPRAEEGVAPEEAAAVPPGKLDPSEEITPEELATIPEPVPRGAAPSGRAPAPPRESSGEAPSGPSGTSPVENHSPEGSVAPQRPSEALGGAWSVQVYASESRTEAQRVARAASARLGIEASVERDGALYKVRLGRFASESDAQALRERAIAAGYPGAFRTRVP